MPRHLARAAVALALLSGPMAPPALAAPWKTCAFNDQPLRCRDSHAADGTVRIAWEDGKAMTYRLVEEGFPVSTLRDSLGGTWERQVFVQGNAEFTNPANGNRIFVPVRCGGSALHSLRAGENTARPDSAC